MSIPVTTGVGKTRWTQGEDGEAGLEIRIPLTLPDGIRPRDLTVEVKDTAVLCIRHESTRILQWRLYAPVKDEVEWRVESDKMILDLEKRSPAVWSCLLELPMSNESPLLVDAASIDRMFLQQLPSLPPIKEQWSDKETKETKEAEKDAEDIDDLDQEPEYPSEDADGNAVPAKKDDNDDDLDKLLEEAVEEAKGPEAKADEEEGDEPTTGYAAYMKAELENYRMEEEEITKKLREVDQVLIDPSDNDATSTAREQKNILETMLRLHNECRDLRTQPSSLENFLRCTQIDLAKARVNIGELDSNETEEYKSDDERSMSAAELMATGLQFLETQDIGAALHFLRLAAIHHKQDQSIVILYSIYSQLGSPRGAFLLLNRALDDENPSELANQKVGEMYDQGSRFFLPTFPAALHFYQRAAKLGNVSAMLSLAQLWLRGSTSTSMLTEDQIDSLKSTSKYLSWLDEAINRGCGSAYFVKGCMYLKGEHGLPKSHANAKENLEAAQTAQPEIIRRAPQIMTLLEQLRMEEAGEEAAPASTPGLTASSRGIAPSAAAPSGDVAVTSSEARLRALPGGAGAGAGAGRAAGVARTKKAFGASSRQKAFWERATVSSIVVYGVYTLAFPLRVALMPMFYSLLGSLVDAVPWLGNPSNSDISF